VRRGIWFGGLEVKGKRGAVTGVVAVLVTLLAATFCAVSAAATELMPGVTYERHERIVRGSPVIVHVVTAPKPGSLYQLAPVLSNGTIAGTETVTQMQARVSPRATTVAVNGDMFSWEESHTSGILMRNGVLDSRPAIGRSSLGIGLDGLLRIARISFFGTWGIAELPREPLNQLNRPLVGSQVGLFTPVWGAPTPERRGAVDVVISALPPATPNIDLAGQVVEVRRGGGTAIPDGGAVLQATGALAAGLEARAVPGSPFVVKLILKPWWEQVADALGGGPVLVRDGRLALPTTEEFTSDQLLGRHPRTAVGQLAGGRILLVAVDGRSSQSAGMTIRDLALELQRLKAVTAMNLDGGGSTTLALEGDVLNVPSEGTERSVSDALMIMYYGAYAAFPASPVVSPNGDGAVDGQRLDYKLVRPSTVDVRLVGPGGNVLWRDEGHREPGTYPLEPDLAGRPEGRWRWVVRATDDEGNPSEALRTFTLNNTLGFLDLSADRVKRGRSVGVSFQLARGARLAVSVESTGGAPVRTLFAGWHKRGELDLSWNGRTSAGKVARAGSYTVRVRAENRYGEVALADSVLVRR
jgi:hypothetical protein